MRARSSSTSRRCRSGSRSRTRASSAGGSLPPLSIVIPAYAEAKYLGGTLRALREFLGARAASTEVIVVTADAADGTVDIAAHELAAFPLAQHLRPGAKVGKGRDVRAGMLAAHGDVVLFMDADLATPLRYIDAAVEAVTAGHDVVIGCRDLPRIHGQLARSWSTQLANRAIRALLLPGISDTQCGFKAFRGAIVKQLFEPLATTGWGFDLEVLARARRAGLSIAEIGVPEWADPKGDHGLAGEFQWWSRLRTLGELAVIRARLGRQGGETKRWK